MKKSFSAFLVMLTLVSSLTYSRPSSAASALLAGAAGAALGGLSMLAAGAFVGVVGSRLDTSGDMEFIPGLGVLTAIVGIIVLDGEEGQTVSFAEVSKAQAQKIGVTESERNIFNRELDQVNALLAEVASRTDSPAEAKEMWMDLKDSVSTESFNVMTKVVSQKF